jgi:hypothetical protein
VTRHEQGDEPILLHVAVERGHSGGARYGVSSAALRLAFVSAFIDPEPRSVAPRR